MGMTAATSEYAMLDSMFAMDPVFPGLGGLEGMDSLEQQFMPNWSNNNNNNNLSSIPQIQANPIQPTFSSTLPPPNQNQQNNTMVSSTDSNNTLLTTPPIDLPNSPWSTWLSGQGQAQTLEDGMMAGGAGVNGTKRTMSSSEVYKKVTKP
jgi:hypothetical protein